MSDDILKRIEHKLDKIIEYIEEPRVRLKDYSAEWDAMGQRIRSSDCYKKGMSMTEEQKDFWRGLGG